MFVLLEGELHGQRDHGTVFVLAAPHISGMLPYSRLKTFPAAIRARHAGARGQHGGDALSARCWSASRNWGSGWWASCPTASARTPGRTQQREKLMALGKLSAGLAHELNNPAAAARRAAESLREPCRACAKPISRLDQQPLTAEQRALLPRFEQEWLAVAVAPDDALEQSDREQALGDWLERTPCGGRLDDRRQPGRSRRWTPRAWKRSAAGFPRRRSPMSCARLSSSLQVGRLVDEIESATSRISDLVKAVKEYSYMDQGPVQEIDIHQGLDTTLLILNHQLKQRRHGDARVRPHAAEDLRARQRAQPGVDEPDRQRHRRHGRQGRAAHPHGARAGVRAGRDRRQRPGHRAARFATAFSIRSSPPSRWATAAGWGSTWCTGSCTAIMATCVSNRSRARQNFRCGCRCSRKEAYERVQSCGPDPAGNSAHERMRGVSEDGRPLGAPAPVHDLRSRRMLRFVEEQARDEAFSSDASIRSCGRSSPARIGAGASWTRWSWNSDGSEEKAGIPLATPPADALRLVRQSRENSDGKLLDSTILKRQLDESLARWRGPKNTTINRIFH